MSLDERVRAIEVQMDAVQKDVKELVEYVQGPPRELSLRGRVYALEGNNAAAKAATAALEAARAIQGRRWSRRQTWLVAVAGSVVALCAITTTAVVLAQALS